MADNNAVQLGFSLPLHNKNNDDDDQSNASEECNQNQLGHQSPHWSDWDGGKIGGTPSWLNPRDLPTANTPLLRCRGPCSSGISTGGKKKTGTALRFIAQLYCPADDVTENDAAFHRSLYVFACPTCCSESAETFANEEKKEDGSPASFINRSDCVRVLRCQLPKRNEFYPTTGDDYEEDEEWTKHSSRYWAELTDNDKLNLCAVCGRQSQGKCPKQKLWFCGPEHQKECLRASKKQQEQQPNSSSNDTVPLEYLPSVFYESELVVEGEPTNTTDADATNSTDANADSYTASTTSKDALFPSKDLTDADADLEQSDLNAMTGSTSLAQAATGVTDPTTLAFYARMAVGGKDNDVRDQCLRYCRWPENKEEGLEEDDDEEGEDVGPLWLSSNNRPPTRSATDSAPISFPPPCQYCGAPRCFEFQILPQMLHYLLQSPNSTSTDDGDESNVKPRQVLTESERAILLEAASKIESGMDLPEGFREQHEAALKNAREALLGVSSSRKAGGKANNDDGTLGGTKGGFDWGTIAVYTCTASCGDGGVVSPENGAYMEESAWMQPPLD